MDIKLISVPSSGTSTGIGCTPDPDLAKSGMRFTTSMVYPPSPRGQQLRRVREGEDRFGHVSLGHAARALGLSVTEVSGLETGRYTLATEAEWDQVEQVVRASRPKAAP